jgi:hypothetical protein
MVTKLPLCIVFVKDVLGDRLAGVTGVGAGLVVPTTAGVLATPPPPPHPASANSELRLRMLVSFLEYVT